MPECAGSCYSYLSGGVRTPDMTYIRDLERRIKYLERELRWLTNPNVDLIRGVTMREHARIIRIRRTTQGT